MVSAPGEALTSGERLLTVREVARLLHIATSTVYKLCSEGTLAHVRVSNAIRVEPSALEALGRPPTSGATESHS